MTELSNQCGLRLPLDPPPERQALKVPDADRVDASSASLDERVEALIRNVQNEERDQQAKAPQTISFPYSRHPSVHELRQLVSVFQPLGIYPCTTSPPEAYREEISLEKVFGDVMPKTTVYAGYKPRQEKTQQAESQNVPEEAADQCSADEGLPDQKKIRRNARAAESPTRRETTPETPKSGRLRRREEGWRAAIEGDWGNEIKLFCTNSKTDSPEL